MVTAYQKTSQVIVGSIDCYGSRWLSVGMHLSKFDKWLPGGNPRPIDIGPTANILCPQRLFRELGGFSPNRMLSDTLSTEENVKQLRKEIYDFTKDVKFKKCNCMGAIVKTALDFVKRNYQDVSTKHFGS